MSHALKQRIYEQFARVGKTLGSASRLELLDLLAQGERSVDELARQSELSVANASQHLRLLQEARLVESRRDGRQIYYRLAAPSVERLYHAVRAVAEDRLAELGQVARDYLVGRDQFEPIDRRELARRIKDGSVVLIDVRPPEEYEAQHIAGAVSVPLAELSAFARSAPRRKQVVAYCRGPYCVYALDAVRRLQRLGVHALRSEDGVSEWRAAGLPVAPAPAGTPRPSGARKAEPARPSVAAAHDLRFKRGEA
jgi:rhodanese-related sulfurtransferase/DNA-binding transcriptional ArsR family regulator